MFVSYIEAKKGWLNIILSSTAYRNIYIDSHYRFKRMTISVLPRWFCSSTSTDVSAACLLSSVIHNQSKRQYTIQYYKAMEPIT